MAQQTTDQDLRLAIANLTQDVKVGFADIRGDIKELKGDIKALDNKFEERTKSFGQRLDKSELLTNAVVNTIVGGLLLALAKFLFFGKF
jgi:hypothetical protein